MIIRKHIRTIAIGVFLLQFGSELFPIFPLAGTSMGGHALTGLAWAAEENPGGLETSSEQQTEQERQNRPPNSSGESASEPKGGETKPSQPENTVKPEGPQKDRGFMDVLHGQLSQQLLSTASWLDSYFGDERYLLEQNRSYLRVRYDVFQEERANILIRPAIDLRLVLPQLEKKTHLVFSAEPTQTPSNTGTPVTPTGERITTTDERNLTTSLQYFVRSAPKESFIVRTGVQLTHGQPVLLFAPRYRSLIPLNSWDFRFTEEATYRTDTQWQTDTILDFERKLIHNFFFRTSLEGLWFANTQGYFYSLSFSLREAFDATHALDYEWVNSFQTRPSNELTEVALRLRYRHSFLREWFFFEVAPQIRFPRTGNFDILPGILFRIEMYFGRQEL